MARHRWAVSSAAVLILCLCATSIFAIQQAQIAQRQALLASRETAKATATNKFLVSVFSGAGIGTPTRKHPNEMTAVELLDSGSEQMFASLEQQPEAMLELIRAVGDIYTLMEDVDKSIALYRRGINFSERKFGSNNPMETELLVRIASDEAFAGRISVAAKDVLIAEQAVEAGGDHHARYYAELLKVKGNLLMLQGASFGAEATQTLQSAIALYEERFADDPGYALSLSYLARVLMNLNEDDAAEKAAERAVFAAENPNTTLTNRANAYSLRASVRRRLGKLQRAADDYAAASAYFAQSVGTHHFLFLQNEGMRGELAQMSGKRDSGLAIIEATTNELSAIRPGTTTHAIAARRLASAYLRDGSYDKALAAFGKAIEVIRPMHVPEPLSQDLLGQAEAFIALGRLDEAQRSADEAGELMPFKDGVRVPAVAHTQYVLGVIALARGDLDSASRFAKRARDATQDSVRERVRLERIYALESQVALAHADAHEALERTQAALELLKADGAKSNLFVKTETLARHGVALCHAQRTTEGSQLLTDQLAVLRKIRNPSGHPLDEFERELSRCNPAHR